MLGTRIDPIPLFAHCLGWWFRSHKCKNEHLVFESRTDAAAQAVAGSIVGRFRKMSASRKALHSVSSQRYLFLFLVSMCAASLDLYVYCALRTSIHATLMDLCFACTTSEHLLNLHLRTSHLRTFARGIFMCLEIYECATPLELSPMDYCSRATPLDLYVPAHANFCMRVYDLWIAVNCFQRSVFT